LASKIDGGDWAVAANADVVATSPLLVGATGAGASTIGWQHEPVFANRPEAGGRLCLPRQQLALEQQPTFSLQQLRSLRAPAFEHWSVNRPAIAGQTTSRCPSAQMQAVWGIVPIRNAGMSISATIGSR
jgi:hypothetical protein